MSSFFLRQRQRAEPTQPPLIYDYSVLGHAPYTHVVNQPYLNETVIDGCHNGAWPPPRGSRTDIGGRFALTRSERSYPQWFTVNLNHIQGSVFITQVPAAWQMGNVSALPVADATLNIFGTTAIARVLPTNPNSSLSTALGELRKDGLPSIPGSSHREQANIARRAGSEYLNAEFGWLPLINDIRSFADSVKRSRQIIDQYRRDSDRKIRRRYTPAPVVLSTQVFTGGQGQCSAFYPVLDMSMTRTRVEEYSFSGAFRYHVPVGDDFYSRLRRYEQYSHRLFDTRLTPELLWNLAPWSWAVDWFTNAGDVIHNISALGADGLVMQYGYAMRHSLIDEIAIGTAKISSNRTVYGPVSFRIKSETKQRVPAHPYGFGITDASLNKTQWAILAALGLTRGQRPGSL